ncbi:MAG: hypothetical protein WCB67_07650, partial [Solirubrobacteraceae bacterium]
FTRERSLVRNQPCPLSQASFSRDRFSVAELSVRAAESDLLLVDPLAFGPGAPATAALAPERGPQPDDVSQRDE